MKHSEIVVATVLTACGIETYCLIEYFSFCLVATVLTVYGIYDEYTHKSLVIAFMLENLNQ